MADGPRSPTTTRARLRGAAPTHDTEAPVYEWRDELRRALPVTHDPFDRIRFARRVIDVLRPPHLAVLIRHGHRVLRVETGEDWARPGRAWATVAIPRDATRADIVLAMLDLVGAREDPYWLDVLLNLPDED